MSDIFISHVEEDAEIALAIAGVLEAEGFSTWYYQRDSLPGLSYLDQIDEAIEQSRAVVVVVSLHSLGSWQVDKEIVRAHECGKHFLPVLRGITHFELQKAKRGWRMAFGVATALQIPTDGVNNILPRIVAALIRMGLSPMRPASVVAPDEQVQLKSTETSVHDAPAVVDPGSDGEVEDNQQQSVLFASAKPNGAAASYQGRAHSPGARSRPFPRRLVFVLIAVVCAALVLAGILAIINDRRRPGSALGFSPENVLTVQLPAPRSTFPSAEDRKKFYTDVTARMEALPGVQSAGVVDSIPFSGNDSTVEVIGEGSAQPSSPLTVTHRVIGPGYFEVLRIALLRGRAFVDVDNSDSRGVVIVNAALSRQLFNTEDVVGKRLALKAGEANSGVWHEIVGVVADVSYARAPKPLQPEVYEPYLQNPQPSTYVLVRTTVDSPALIDAVQQQIRGLDKEQSIINVKTMKDVMKEAP